MQSKTDSQAIIRLVKRIKSETSPFNYAYLPIIYLLVNMVILYQGSKVYYSEEYQQIVNMFLAIILACQICLCIFSYESDESLHRPNFFTLLKAPEFPQMDLICPHCRLVLPQAKEHCLKCNKCVVGFHYHGIVCVKKSN